MAELFTKIPPAAARLATLFARRAGGLSFRTGGAEWTFFPAVPGNAPHGVAAYGRLGEAEYSLWLDEPEWRVAAAAVLEIRPEDAADFHGTLIQAALECFFSEALAALEKTLGLPLAVTRVETREIPPLASAVPFRLAREDGLVLSGAWLAKDGKWREAMEAALRRVEPSRTELPGDLLVEGTISAGIWRLAARELTALEIGDVVLSPAEAFWGVTVGRRFRFAAVVKKGRLVADGKKAVAVAAGDAVSGMETAELADIDEAEVELRAEVGRLDVTLAELRRLAVGEVVEFATGVDSPATLVAGGRAVAFGELVDVGGRVGVRITALAKNREQ